MAKTKVSEFDATAANNTDIDSINIAEGMAPSSVNNALRSMMSILKTEFFKTGSNNTSLGDTALDSLDGTSPGGSNTAIGFGALTANTTANNNTAVGFEAAKSTTTGTEITAVGRKALTSNTTGNFNTATGLNSLLSNTTGDSNVAIGVSALGANTTASNNTAVGMQALTANTTAESNTGVGKNALATTTTGAENSALGHNSLLSNTTGANNTAIGMSALKFNTTASNNTAVGTQSLQANTTASFNTAVGHSAGGSLTTGPNNTLVGAFAGDNLTTGFNNTFIGAASGNCCGGLVTTGGKNTIVGGFDGNQDSLDIRTSSNNVVLSDGDGIVMAYFNSNRTFVMGNNQFGGLSNTLTGNFLRVNDRSQFNVNGSVALAACRLGNDGTVMEFKQGGTVEGSVSISGTTTSFNGGHLSRWAQLSDGSKDTSIVKGTVMTNLDQMAVWPNRDFDGVATEGNEANEQLNCMAVSSVEGDANVAGVFVNWDDDDDLVNDMNVAMTGDMVIRIAQGTTVARGDLLMSAGDGTAKPQDDDIVRSKTIAKVTSTNKSHTYDDGSYLVPCVLMAC